VKAKNNQLELYLTIFFLSLLSILTFVDIFNDIDEGIPLKHWLHECFLVAGAVIIIIYKMALAVARIKTIDKISSQLNIVQGEVDYYKNKVSCIKTDFFSVIQEQFKLWNLTKSESDVALFIIKGMSMKEIAEIRGSNESTVKQQANSIYKKSHLEGRKHLTAYFLDELFSEVIE
jgi:DNA-binding CsgD family transcriptional regulator